MLTVTITQAVLSGMALVIVGAILGAWMLSEFIRMGELGCDDLIELQGNVDQDGETVYPAISWRNASVKVPHADSSAATFHRAER